MNGSGDDNDTSKNGNNSYNNVNQNGNHKKDENYQDHYQHHDHHITAITITTLQHQYSDIIFYYHVAIAISIKAMLAERCLQRTGECNDAIRTRIARGEVSVVSLGQRVSESQAARVSSVVLLRHVCCPNNFKSCQNHGFLLFLLLLLLLFAVAVAF